MSLQPCVGWATVSRTRGPSKGGGHGVGFGAATSGGKAALCRDFWLDQILDDVANARPTRTPSTPNQREVVVGEATPWGGPQGRSEGVPQSGCGPRSLTSRSQPRTGSRPRGPTASFCPAASAVCVEAMTALAPPGRVPVAKGECRVKRACPGEKRPICRNFDRGCSRDVYPNVGRLFVKPMLSEPSSRNVT
jgi:hypothetical protein